MIAGIFHSGSGLGNQLHRYVATRVLALDKGYDFSFINPEGFKGKDFMSLDFGIKNNIYYDIETSAGKIIPKKGEVSLWEEWNKYCYDPDINFVEDNTIIDGSFEDERYFGHRLPEVSKWLKTEPVEVEDDLCMIGFRGGEYYGVPELGLPLEYYERAIAKMKEVNPDMRFQVHTDDPKRAKMFFPDLECVQNIGINWRVMRCAKYAIIANSSFYILPRLLRHDEHLDSVTIAPKYFNRYNVKKWDYPQFYYKSFKYI